jgi:hypothetical protein
MRHTDTVSYLVFGRPSRHNPDLHTHRVHILEMVRFDRHMVSGQRPRCMTEGLLPLHTTVLYLKIIQTLFLRHVSPFFGAETAIPDNPVPELNAIHEVALISLSTFAYARPAMNPNQKSIPRNTHGSRRTP